MDEIAARQAVLDAIGRVAPELDVRTCDASAPMNDELELDSMDLLSVLAEIAARTGVEVPDGAVAADSSLDELVAVLSSEAAS